MDQPISVEHIPPPTPITNNDMLNTPIPTTSQETFPDLLETFMSTNDEITIPSDPSIDMDTIINMFGGLNNIPPTTQANTSAPQACAPPAPNTIPIISMECGTQAPFANDYHLTINQSTQTSSLDIVRDTCIVGDMPNNFDAIGTPTRDEWPLEDFQIIYISDDEWLYSVHCLIQFIWFFLRFYYHLYILYLYRPAYKSCIYPDWLMYKDNATTCIGTVTN